MAPSLVLVQMFGITFTVGWFSAMLLAEGKPAQFVADTLLIGLGGTYVAWASWGLIRAVSRMSGVSAKTTGFRQAGSLSKATEEILRGAG